MLVGLQRDEGGGWGRVWRTQDAEAEGGAGGGAEGDARPSRPRPAETKAWERCG